MEISKRRGRGLGKKPPLFCTSLRLSKEVMEYFNKHYPYTKQAKMREILTDYIKQQGANNETSNEQGQNP